MKTFERFDVIMQWSLIVASVAYLGVKEELEYLIHAYFLVGGWQMISMIVHAIAWRNDPSWRRGRRIYSGSVFLIVVITALSAWLELPIVFWIFYGLLFLSPFMAIFYAGLCTKDLLQLKKERSKEYGELRNVTSEAELHSPHKDR